MLSLCFPVELRSLFLWAEWENESVPAGGDEEGEKDEEEEEEGGQAGGQEEGPAVHHLEEGGRS